MIVRSIHGVLLHKGKIPHSVKVAELALEYSELRGDPIVSDFPDLGECVGDVTEALPEGWSWCEIDNLPEPVQSIVRVIEAVSNLEWVGEESHVFVDVRPPADGSKIRSTTAGVVHAPAKG